MPVRLQIEVGTGVNYSGGDLGTLELLSQHILVSHEGEIEGWLNNLRQQQSISPLGVVNGQLSFHDMQVEYSRIQKHESLTITAFPAPPTPPPGSNPYANIFDVSVDFQGYPVGDFETFGLYTWAGFNKIVDDTITTDDFPFSVPVPWSVDDMGVTGVCSDELIGLQYFEVQIKALPKSVPDPLRLTFSAGIDDGSYLDCSIVTTTRTASTYLFPKELDTWLTPAIGFIPKQLKPDIKKNTVVDDMLVGFDTDDTILKARTVYIVPLTSQIDEVDTKNWQNAVYALQNPYTSSYDSTGTRQGLAINYPIGPAPDAMGDEFILEAQVMIDDYNPVLYANSHPKPTIRMQESSFPMGVPAPQHKGQTRGDQSCIGVGGKYVLVAVSGLRTIALDQFTVADVEAAIAALDDVLIGNYPNLPWYDHVDDFLGGFTIDAPLGGDWLIGATTEAPQYKGFVAYNDFYAATTYVDQLGGKLKYTPGKFVTASFADEHLVGDYLEGPTANISQNSGFLTFTKFNGGNSIAYEYEQDPGYVAPQGVNAVGSHTWLLKGRGDLLDDSITPADDGPLVPLRGGNGALNNGVFSGVDLGALKEDDTVMFATDTGSRRVYVGINGHWYDKNGKSKATPGSAELLPGMLLDGDGTQDYYPAATLRVGKSHVRFTFGSACKYPLPPGYKYFGKPPS